MTFKIAKNELRNMFYSPVAWFLTLIFLIQCAIYYSAALGPYAVWQDILLRNNPKWKNFGDTSLTMAFFLGQDGLLANVLQNVYLFIPLLTMGLISREINNGSIKLLYSSPVKLKQVVFGKFLAVLVYNLVLAAVLGLFIATTAVTVKSIDGGLLLSAMLGFYLMVCAYSAIGLFMSSLTTYQIVSAISTFTIIFILSHIGSLWQKYDFVRDLTYFLSLQGRTAKMVGGLITTKDVFYFLIIMCMFLAFTILRLQGDRETRPWWIKAGRYALVAVSGLLIGYVSSRPRLTGYWDTTACNVNTIHPRTQNILRQLEDGPLEVTLYTNLLDMGTAVRGVPEARNLYLSQLWDQYLRFKPDIVFKYEYYYDYDPVFNYYYAGTTDSMVYKNFPGKTLKEIASEMATGADQDISLFKSPEEMHKEIDLDPEGYRLVMRLKYKGRTEFVRTFDDPDFWPSEVNLNAAFKRLLQASLPRVAFVTGGLERNIYKTGEREFQRHSLAKAERVALINIGFVSDTINLSTQDIPSNITTVVLADPKVDLTPLEIVKLKKYIAGGGNMLINGEPGKQQVLNPLLRELNIQLMPGQIIQPSFNETPEKVQPYLTPAAAYLSEDKTLTKFKRLLLSHDTDDTLKISTPGVTAVSFKDSLFRISPLMLTSDNVSWLKEGKLVLDSAAPVFATEEGDVRGSFATGLQLTRKISNKEQRILVFGDVDFMCNMRVAQSMYFLISCYSWLSDNQFPIYTPRPSAEDNLLYIGPKGAAALRIVYIWIVPALILLAGTIILIRRKRK
ncbi:Gldg family protein [Flavitalea sp. BT771]|uniref:Gldg family protein n=1 Tax=Flavitalea sp. BT771 TaxID=3063329 RepID=UPI0026E12A43|nr:Gldg family protein [Flavitalea sp. BT771]MDO6430069.1 Gldg family protein [Flavitalea sp. BT771]MDV6219792.1 Gldg family protein [Flavitalea sp. BT771]